MKKLTFEHKDGRKAFLKAGGDETLLGEVAEALQAKVAYAAGYEDGEVIVVAVEVEGDGEG